MPVTWKVTVSKVSLASFFLQARQRPGTDSDGPGPGPGPGRSPGPGVQDVALALKIMVRFKFRQTRSLRDRWASDS